MAWGDNAHGELGDGTTTNQESPELIIAGLWHSAVYGGDGWYYLGWFGWFNTKYSPWIYHLTLGWLYPVATSTDDLIFWDQKMSAFCWTSATLYPFTYRFSDNTWLYYEIGTSSPELFWNFRTKSVQTWN